MGTNLLPTVFQDNDAEIPSASKWNNNNDFLNLTWLSLINNGDMEAFSGTLPTGWTLVGAGAVSASDADSKHAALAVKLTYGTADSYLTQTAIEIKFPKGRQVKAWVWVKTSVPNQARIKITDGVATTASAYHSGGNTYELLEVTHQVAANATTLKIELHVESAGFALFDAAVLVDSNDARGFIFGQPDPSNPASIFSIGKLIINGTADIPPTANEITKENIVKAWVKFAGASGVIAKSFNIASVVRTAAGIYTVTFSTAFADADYVMAGSCYDSNAANDGFVRAYTTAPTTTAMQINTVKDNGADFDPTAVMLMFIGNQ